jgi:hypothetical protein
LYDEYFINKQLREPFTWNVIWLVAEKEHKSRNEVLNYPVWEFLEIVDFVFKDLTNKIGQ